MIKAVLKGEIRTQEASLWLNREQEGTAELRPKRPNPPSPSTRGRGADQVPSPETLQKHSGSPGQL